MNRTFFAPARRPVLTAIMAADTPQALIGQARGAEFAGAQAIAVDLAALKLEHRNQAALAQVMAAVDLPFMFFYYRNDQLDKTATDVTRQPLLLDAARAGAAVIDVMGDLFDASPREITDNPEAIAKQKALIKQIHDLGAQVVMSSHMNEALKAADVLAHLRKFEERGADILKIVTAINTDEEFSEAVRTTMLLHRELKRPFIFLNNGKFGRLHRFIGPALGVDITFVVYHHELAGMTQPSVAAMKTVLDNLHWQLED